MKKIFDVFLFNNEIDMLSFRLEYLNDIVDKFIIVECSLTHSGKPKKLYYKDNKDIFTDYNDKIINVIATDLLDASIEKDSFVRKNKQRNSWINCIKDIEIDDNDLILISDVDEIPDKNSLENLKNNNVENVIYSFEQDIYLYNLYCKKNDKNNNAKALNYLTFKTIANQKSSDIRSNSVNIEYINIPNGGWHFSYFGNVDFIKNKIKSFAYQEFYRDEFLDDVKILNQIKECKDIFFRDDHVFSYNELNTNNYLPANHDKLLVFNELYDNNK